MKVHKYYWFLLAFVPYALLLPCDWMLHDGSKCPQGPQQDFGLPNNTVTTVCCNDGTGCFSSARGTPGQCFIRSPDCMDQMQPKFNFFTKESNPDFVTIDYFNLNSSVNGLLKNSKEKRPLFVIIHGFSIDARGPWQTPMKDALIALGNNVIVVNWSGGSRNLDYFRAASNIRTIGAALAKVMRTLDDFGKASINSSTIVGFSLGAHVAGYAGKCLPGLKRIVGIDPAGPLFHCVHQDIRLDKSDAKFVLTIHTNGDFIALAGLGTLQPSGHVDLYVNGGSHQAGCFDKVTFNLFEVFTCSHYRGPQIYIEMLKIAKNASLCNYISVPCQSKQEWSSGSCFRCQENIVHQLFHQENIVHQENIQSTKKILSTNKCPPIGYTTDVGFPYRGTYYLNTLSDNETTGVYCGRQFLVSLQSQVDVFGKIEVALKGVNTQSKRIQFQSLIDVIKAGISKQTVVVVPWQLTKIKSVEILYSRNIIMLLKSPVTWTLKSFQLTSLNGEILKNVEREITIRDNKEANVDLA